MVCSMRKYLFKHQMNQKGQALVLGVFLVLATSMGLVLMYNTGQTTSEKTRLVNAADASAYSGAVFMARSLNFSAYTNRAMIANHVAVGHFVSYVSWIRYVKDSITRLNSYTQFVPYAGPLIAAAKKALTWIKKGTEKAAPIIIKGADVINSTIYKAQKLTQSTKNGVLSISSLLAVKIMDKVGKTYHPTIRVNSSSDINSATRTVAAAQAINDMKNVLGYVSTYKPGKDKNRMRRMVTKSYDKSKKWIQGNRGWDVNLLILKLDKYGNTSHKMNKNVTDWKADDRLVKRWWTLKGWKSSIGARGKASAREFAKKYKGVPGYVDLKNLKKNASQVLNLSAYATMPISTTKFMKLMGMKPGVQRIAALSRAEIFHTRPIKKFNSPGKGEYANLYNPFWQVRLVKNSI